VVPEVKEMKAVDETSKEKETKSDARVEKSEESNVHTNSNDEKKDAKSSEENLAVSFEQVKLTDAPTAPVDTQKNDAVTLPKPETDVAVEATSDSVPVTNNNKVTN
jgi:hypothetical protein